MWKKLIFIDYFISRLRWQTYQVIWSRGQFRFLFLEILLKKKVFNNLFEFFLKIRAFWPHEQHFCAMWSKILAIFGLNSFKKTCNFTKIIVVFLRKKLLSLKNKWPLVEKLIFIDYFISRLRWQTYQVIWSRGQFRFLFLEILLKKKDFNNLFEFFL